MTSCQLFVYGTLRSDCGAAHTDLIARNFRFVGRGSVQGQLYEIDGYPGMVLSTSPDHSVKGELYQLTGPITALERLDEYEGCTAQHPQPHEYHRREIRVRLEHGAELIAWAYLYNWPLQDRRHLNNGVYAAICGPRRVN